MPVEHEHRLKPVRLCLWLLAVWLLIAAAQLWRGDLLLTQHEGDTMHMMDMLLRMSQGQQIHRDFHTPLGVLSLAPFYLAMQAGLMGGPALICGQLLVGLLLLPWIGWSCAIRLPKPVAGALPLYLIVLATALIEGGTEPQIALSMSYNRWSWVVSYLVLLPAFFPLVGVTSQRIDGAAIGFGLALLVLLKVTYALALAPVLLLALLVSRRWQCLATAGLAGLSVLVLVSLWAGSAFWLDYARDLLAVASSPLRDWPSRPITAIISSPAFVVANLVLLASVAVLRRSGFQLQGLLLLALLPALIYIVAQNFGNDSQWLGFLAALLLAHLPKSPLPGQTLDTRARLVLGSVALALAMPSAINLLSSTARQFTSSRAAVEQVAEGNPAFRGLIVELARRNALRSTKGFEDPALGLERYVQKSGVKPLTFKGETIAFCEVGTGFEILSVEIAADLMANGHAGKRIWVADMLSLIWLMGDFPPVIGVAPWSYGGLGGIENAELVVLPSCPINHRLYRSLLEALEEQKIPLIEIRRTPLYRLYQRSEG